MLYEDVHDIRHRVETQALEPTKDLPMPHVVEAEVVMPITGYDEETNKYSFNGSERSLRLSLRTDWMPRRSDGDRPGGAPTGYVTRADKEGLEQRVLAEVNFKFNTRRILGLYVNVLGDGLAAGIEPTAIDVGTKQNMLLRYVSQLAGCRPLGVRSAAEVLSGASLATAQSSERIRGWVDITRTARQVQKISGKPVPASLRGVPRLEFKSDTQISSDPEKDLWSKSRYVLHEYNFNGKDFRHVFTDWHLAQFTGHIPISFPALEYYSAYDADGERGHFSDFAIDAVQTVRTAQGETEKVAESYAEARDMMSPYINAVTSFRRYYHAAAREHAAA